MATILKFSANQNNMNVSQMKTNFSQKKKKKKLS